MNLSTRGRYGARAMVELAVCGSAEPLDVRTISDRQSIPTDYLSQILHTLRKAGLVKSVRGVRGGYILARPASQISLLEILAVLEKTMTPVECVDEPDCCKYAKDCPTRFIWKKLKHAVNDVLNETSLEELAGAQANGN